MRVLILDGHLDDGRLVSHLLDHYQAERGATVELERMAVRDLIFDPILRHGYKRVQRWEPTLSASAPTSQPATILS